MYANSIVSGFGVFWCKDHDAPSVSDFVSYQGSVKLLASRKVNDVSSNNSF